jgi:hypothetical protein
MREFLKYTFTIAAASLLIASLIAYIFENAFLANSTTRSGYKLERFYKFEDDVLFLGSSRAQQTFMVDSIFAQGKLYNYGLDGTGNWLWRHQLEDLVKNGKQELIVINVDPPSLDLVTDWNVLEYFNIPHESAVFRNLEPSLKRSIGYFPFKYFGSYLELFRTAIKEWINVTSYQFKGTQISIKSNIEGMFYAREFAKDSLLNCNGPGGNHLLRILNNQTEDQIVFVKIPTYQGQLSDPFFKHLSPLIQEGAPVHFIDHSNILQEQELWYDHVHFTLKGAEVYSKLLKEELRALEDAGNLQFPQGVLLAD